MSTASSRVERNASTRSWGDRARTPPCRRAALLSRGKLEPTHRGVKRGEKPILDEHSRAGEGIEQTGLAGVGVADDRRGGDFGAATGLALGCPHRCQVLEARSSCEMRLRARRRSDSSLVSPGPRVPIPPPRRLISIPFPRKREPIAIHRQFDLRPSCPAGGVEGEYVEDERHPVDDVDLEDLLEVALLHRAEFAVDHDEIDVERFADPGQLGGLALADVGRRVGVGAALHRTLHRVRAGGVDQPFHLVERRFHLVGVAVGRDQRDQQGALPSDGDVCDCGCEPAATSGDVAIGHLRVPDTRYRIPDANPLGPSGICSPVPVVRNLISDI